MLRVLKRLKSLTLPPETVALRQGQPNSAMYFVSRGRLSTLMPTTGAGFREVQYTKLREVG